MFFIPTVHYNYIELTSLILFHECEVTSKKKKKDEIHKNFERINFNMDAFRMTMYFIQYFFVFQVGKMKYSLSASYII